MPDTYLRASERRTGPPAASARCPAAPARAASRAPPSHGANFPPTPASAPRMSVRQKVVSTRVIAQPSRHRRRTTRRQPPAPRVPLVREPKHGRVGTCGKRGHFLRAPGARAVAADVDGNADRLLRPSNGGEQRRLVLWLEVGEKEK